MAKASIILSYFSPLGCALPAQHFAQTLQMCVASGAEVCVAQVVQSHQSPVETEGAAHSLVFHSDELIFYKENLWNLAAAQATSDKLIFIDADIYYHRGDWLDQICNALDKFDIIQPFDTAYWEAQNGTIDTTFIRPAWCKAIARRENPTFMRYHPGFGYAMTRSAFAATGGFYELGCMGNGDSMFAVAVTPEPLILPMIRHIRVAVSPRGSEYLYGSYKAFIAPAFIDYRLKVQDANLKVGYTPHCDIFHKWHGTRDNRDYINRHSYVDWPDANPPVRKRKDGLLQWTAPQPRVKQYWLKRDDDGKTKGQKPLRFTPK